MTPQDLKNSILQWAIQGRLVEQRPEDGSAEELLQEIHKEKQGLIKEGKLKKQKPLPEITEEEIPFDIPDSWKWVRLGEIFNLLMGQSPPGNSVSANGDGIEFHQGKVHFGDDYLQQSNEVTNKPSKIAAQHSVLLCVRAPVGIVNITEREICIGRGLCAVTAYVDMNVNYILYLLRSCKSDFIKKATGTTFTAITATTIKEQIIPLPPLAEQERIVARIEELQPYVDRYEKVWTKLEALNKRFPEDLKKSLLQWAIQGRLVEQCPEDGSAEELYQAIQKEKQRLVKEGKIRKQKPLPEITEEEIPFDIPENWKWVRLGEIFNLLMGQSPPGNSVSENGDGIEFHQGKVHFGDDYLQQSNEVTNKPSKIAAQHSVLLCVRAPVGIVNITEREICIGRGLCAVTAHVDMNVKYIFYLLRNCKSDFIKKATGTTFSAITGVTVKEQLVPLPPLAEQERIVAKLEELLPLCEKLNK